MFSRRLGAMLYDGFCLVGLLLAATQIAMMVNGFKPFNGEPLFQVYLLAVMTLYFAWFWSHHGQTIGMRAWKLTVSRRDGQPMSFAYACLRFFAAVIGILSAGLGLFWCLVDREGQTAYDRLMGTRVLTRTSE